MESFRLHPGLEALRDGFFMTDADWRVTYWNPAAERLLHAPRNEMLGNPLWDALPELRDTPAWEHLHHIVVRGSTCDFLLPHPKDPPVVLAMHAAPLEAGGVAVQPRDATDHHRQQVELAHLAAEAQNASRAKTRFFTAVSHELRTPLNAIIGYTHLLSTGAYGEMVEGAERAASRAGICAEHLARLVDDVLLLTTMEFGRIAIAPQRLDLSPYLSASVVAWQHQAEAKGLRFSVDVARNASSIETDPERLRQLLGAVLSNAVKFTSRGAIRIATHASECDAHGYDAADRGLPGSSVPRPWAEITITDTGPGIPQADWQRVFDPFERLGDPARTESMTQGTGLGLTLARQLASLLRGEIWVSDPPGGGAAFHLRLPQRIGASGTV